MEKTYMDCDLGGQPRCPQHIHPFMLALFAGVQQNSTHPIKEITDAIIDNANSLCKDCEKFSPKHQN